MILSLASEEKILTDILLRRMLKKGRIETLRLSASYVTDCSLARLPERMILNLSELEVDRNIHDVGSLLTKISAVEHNLKSVVLEQCGNLDDGLMKAMFRSNSKLENLQISNCQKIAGDFLYKLGMKCLKISSLSLVNCYSVSEKNVLLFLQANRESSESLERLTINSSFIGESIANSISLYCPNLTTLNLRTTHIKGKDLETISRCCTKLKKLDIVKCHRIRISDVAGLLKLAKITHLRFSIDVEDDGDFDVKDNASLEALEIEVASRSKVMTAYSVKKLLNSLPNCLKGLFIRTAASEKIILALDSLKAFEKSFENLERLGIVCGRSLENLTANFENDFGDEIELPNLTELQMKYLAVSYCRVRSQKLKRLSERFLNGSTKDEYFGESLETLEIESKAERLKINCPALKSLKLTNCSANELSVTNGRNIKKLFISECSDLTNISEFTSTFLNLRHVFLGNSQKLSNSDISALAENCPSLENVEICGSPLVDFENLSFNLPKIKYLTFKEGQRFTFYSVKNISGYKNLRELRLHRCQNLTSAPKGPLTSSNDSDHSSGESDDDGNLNRTKLRFSNLQGLGGSISDRNSAKKIDQIAGSLPCERGGSGKVICLRYQFGACLKNSAGCEYAHFPGNLNKISRFKPLMIELLSDLQASKAAKGKPQKKPAKVADARSENERNKMRKYSMEKRGDSITAPNFQNLRLLEISECHALRSIDGWHLPMLEHLSVTNCNTFATLSLSIQKLKYLDLSNCINLEDFRTFRSGKVQVAKFNGCKLISFKFLEYLLDSNRHMKWLEVIGACCSESSKINGKLFPGGKRDAMNGDHFSRIRKQKPLKQLEEGKPNLTVVTKNKGHSR